MKHSSSRPERHHPTIHAARRARRQRLPAVALLAALTLAACVEADPPGLTVKALPANLVFGTPPEPEPAAPAASVVQQPLALPALPPPPTLTITPPRFQPPPLAAPVACPVAGINVFPEEVAARNVDADRRPAVGEYRWSRQGTQSGTHTATFEIPVGGFETRTIQNVVESSATNFSYDMVQRDLVTGQTVVTTFSVRTTGTSVGQDTLGVDPVPDAPEIPTVGEPDRGIAISQILRLDKDGAETARYAPTVPLLLMPLPVRVDEEFQSASTDPTTFQQMQYSGVVQPVIRVDACGEIVEGWEVKGTMTIALNGVTSTREVYDVVFVPQMGGLLVSEHITETSQQGAINASVDVQYTIGQLEPDPIEE